VTNMRFSVMDARADAHAAVPTLAFHLRIAAAGPVQAMLLRCQLQIEPRRRPHTENEQQRLTDLFGEPSRWRDTLKPLIWSRTSLSVPAFADSIEIDVPVPCTYDFEVVSAKYLDALAGGEIPLLFLFSGTVFSKAAEGFRVEQVPWDKEAPYRMPVRIWRELMDAYFPGSAWVRLGRESFDALQRFRTEHGFATCDEALEALVGRAAAVTS
jgi:hypothetical protein